MYDVANKAEIRGVDRAVSVEVFDPNVSNVINKMSTWYICIYSGGTSIYEGINRNKKSIYLPRGRVFKGGREQVDDIGNVWVKHFHGYSPIYTPDLGVVCHVVHEPIYKVVWTGNVFVFNKPSTSSTKKTPDLLSHTHIRECGRVGDWIRHDSGYSLTFNNQTSDVYLRNINELPYNDEPDIVDDYVNVGGTTTTASTINTTSRTYI